MRGAMMAAPESNLVSWDAFWKLMSVFGVILTGAWGVLVGMIRSKASAKLVEQNEEFIAGLLGHAVTKEEMQAALDGHYKDDNDRFDLYGDRFKRMEDRTRDDIKELATRIEGRINTIEENQRTNTAIILAEIRNNRE